MNWHRSSSIQLVISDLNEIAADVYRHRIRPAFRKGGNGAFDASQGGAKYVLPARLSFNIRATFEITDLSADRVSLKAISREDSSCCVTASIDARGRLADIAVPEKSSLLAQRSEIKKDVSHSAAGSGKTHPAIFFDDTP
ncbi:MAG: hypothetical protein HYW57_09445 [Ignavibacteriales bacterium]|nr:hypothetical protein [Ignavibacteriales bacterium]